MKTQFGNDLLPNKEKQVKKSFSLKKTMIFFPLSPEISPESKFKTVTKLKANSTCVKSLELLKKKMEKQRYSSNFDEMISNPQKLNNKRFCRNSETSIRRSNSINAPNSKIFTTTFNDPPEKLLKRSMTSAFKISEAKTILGNVSEMKDSYRKTINSKCQNDKFQSQRKEKHDTDQYSQGNNENDELFTCRSFQKSLQIQFSNEQIAAMINKKRPHYQLNQDGLSDETSFKAILQKIKIKDFDGSKNIVNSKISRFSGKVKNEKNYASPKLVNYNFLIQTPESQKEMRVFEMTNQIQGWQKLN